VTWNCECLHYSTVQYSAHNCDSLHYSTVQYSAHNCDSLHYSTVQYSAQNIQSCLINMCLFCQNLPNCLSFFAFMSHNYNSPHIFPQVLSLYNNNQWTIWNFQIELITCPVKLKLHHSVISQPINEQQFSPVAQLNNTVARVIT